MVGSAIVTPTSFKKENFRNHIMLTYDIICILTFLFEGFFYAYFVFSWSLRDILICVTAFVCLFILAWMCLARAFCFDMKVENITQLFFDKLMKQGNTTYDILDKLGDFQRSALNENGVWNMTVSICTFDLLEINFLG